MISSSYDFAGSTVAISAEERQHFAGLDAFLASLATTATDNPAFRIVVQIAESPALPPDAEILHTGPVWDEPLAIYAVQSERRLLLVPEKALLVVDPKERTATIRITKNAISSVTGLCGMHAIDAAIEATGQMPLHGAALTLPDRSAGLLLHAASGAGKTTTTLQLGFDGFGVFTDDIAVVRQDRSGPFIWGLPRDFKIHKNSACLSARFASLVSGNWDRNGEQPINREALLNAGVRVEPAQPVALRALVHLVRNEATSARPTSVRPISRTEALYALVQDNVRGSNRGVPQFQQRRMEEIAEIARDVLTLECCIGHDFASVAQRLLQALPKVDLR